MNSKVICAYEDKDIRKGMLKIMILGYVRKHRTYPYQLLKAIRSLTALHGNNMCRHLTKNDVYNLTNSLENAGYLKSKVVLNGNKAKKVFTLTRRGKTVVKNKDKIISYMVVEMKRLAKEEFND
jgi:DNA-binding PadR family transcriptional regulator